MGRGGGRQKRKLQELKERQNHRRGETQDERGRIHGIRCVLARTDGSFGRKRHFCMVSTCTVSSIATVIRCHFIVDPLLG